MNVRMPGQTGDLLTLRVGPFYPAGARWACRPGKEGAFVFEDESSCGRELRDAPRSRTAGKFDEPRGASE